MSWERDPLWAKARLFFERASSEPRDTPEFGLWCSLGLELLARATLASISPTLLAEPDRDHKFLLHALDRGSETVPRRSIRTAQVFSLCHLLFPTFSKDDLNTANALVNRRNEELHSGAAAFDEYPTTQWLAGFYRACKSLSTAMGESLGTLFGEDEAKAAAEMLDEAAQEVRRQTLNKITDHRAGFEGKPKEERDALAAAAEVEGLQLATQRRHRVACPACQSVATVQGRPFGKDHITHNADEIVVRQSVSPTSFSCSACGLKLDGYTDLDVAGLGGHYTRTTKYSPEEYYGLINPDNIGPYIEEYLANIGDEYDNE
jgi:hypothetical protein